MNKQRRISCQLTPQETSWSKHSLGKHYMRRSALRPDVKLCSKHQQTEALAREIENWRWYRTRRCPPTLIRRIRLKLSSERVFLEGGNRAVRDKANYKPTSTDTNRGWLSRLVPWCTQYEGAPLRFSCRSADRFYLPPSLVRNATTPSGEPRSSCTQLA